MATSNTHASLSRFWSMIVLRAKRRPRSRRFFDGHYVILAVPRPRIAHPRDRRYAMRETTRRTFLLTSTLAGATVVLDRAPALAQKRELTLLSGNHFVPASDDELRRQAEAFGKQAGISVKVDTIQNLQMPAKRAAEAQTQAGHDLLLLSHADPFLFENLLVDLGPLVDT